MINNLPEKWDVETDFVSVGSGIGGLGGAITAHEQGLSAIVLERDDRVGGVTALSMGEVWIAGNHHAAALGIEDSAESGFRYLQRLSMGYGSDAATLNVTVHGREALSWFEDRIGLRMMVIRGCPDYYYGKNNHAVSEGRMLEVEPFPAQSLGEWQERTRVSPLTPYGMTHHDMWSKGGSAHMAEWDYGLMAERLTNDERCLGSGLVAYFVKGVLDRGIPMETGVNVVELIGDGERIVGVRAEKDGKDYFVKGRCGVLVAVSSFERSPDYAKTVGQQLNIESMVFPTIDGANFRLAGPVGARIARVPDITFVGLHVPGEEMESGGPLYRSAMVPIGLPHSIVVNRAGKRFGNEAFYRDILYRTDAIDGADQTHPNYPCWIVIDSQAREKYPLGTVMPGQELPEGMGECADTLAELGAKLGIDGQALEKTVAEFNVHAEKGEDPEFGRGTHPWSAWIAGDCKHRPHPNLGPLSKGPFYAVQLHRMGGSAIPNTGIVSDNHARALDWNNDPIPGLYVAGNSVARTETGAGMQSGVSNGRGMVHGWLAGQHAAGKPSTLLEQEVRRLGL
ncbi:MAG: FAD-binding protein [Novosphingobium sp.]|nr:FAD-binding protein [Novosphingobium sp.]